MVSRKITCKKLHKRECRKRGVCHDLKDDDGWPTTITVQKSRVSSTGHPWWHFTIVRHTHIYTCTKVKKKMYLVLPAWVPNTWSLMKVKNTCLAFSFCQLQKHIAACICAVGSIKDTHLQNSISWPFVFSKEQFILEFFITSTKKTLNHLMAGTNYTIISQSCQMFC